MFMRPVQSLHPFNLEPDDHETWDQESRLYGSSSAALHRSKVILYWFMLASSMPNTVFSYCTFCFGLSLTDFEISVCSYAIIPNNHCKKTVAEEVIRSIKLLAFDSRAVGSVRDTEISTPLTKGKIMAHAMITIISSPSHYFERSV